MKTRYAFIHFPNFCHQHVNISLKHPYLVLVKERHRALIVSDLSDVEYALGIRKDMPLAHAQAIVPTLVHHPHDDNAAKSALLACALEAMRFSPHVACDNDYGLVLNSTGCAHLFGGEAGMLRAMSAFFANKGFRTIIAIADNLLLAKALAYFRGDCITDQASKHYYNSLPVDALFLSPTITSMLYDLGIERIESLVQLPKKMLAARFGITLLQQLDQLMGAISLPIHYLEEKPQFTVKEHFTAPIRTHEHFMHAVETLLTHALSKLCEYHYSLRIMTIYIKNTHKKISHLTIESSRPTNQRSFWLELLELKTQNTYFKDGIDSLKIELTHFERITTEQGDFLSPAPTHGLSHITDKLKSKLGERAIFQLRFTQHHMPEYAIARTSTITHEPSAITFPKRPLRLLKNPIPVTAIALLPDNPPAKIMWKTHSFTVIHANGPERIEHEWWNGPHEPYRDYFCVENEEGKRLWIYSSGEPKQWFIHGVFG